jgi:hypothetical protein
VGIERDIFHLLRLPSRLTPPSVSLTHTVKRPCAEAQRFHAIKNPPDSLGGFLCSRDRELGRRPVGDWSDAGQLAASGPRSRHPEEVDLREDGRRRKEAGSSGA